jgi:polyisoprenoid-binding protein YceI
MKRVRWFALLWLAVMAVPAQAAVFNTVQPDKSRLAFTFKEMGVAIKGGFSRFTAQLHFDPAKPATASATIDVDLASVDAGSPDANDEVAGTQWFNTKAFPHARFVSSAVRALGGNRYEAVGTLTIKGRSRTITAPFTYVGQGATARFDGGFTLKRADFAIGEGEWADFGTVANEVQVVFQIQAGQSAARK